MHKLLAEVEQEMGRTPTVQELAGLMDVDGPKVRWMLQVGQPPISLEAPLGDDEDGELSTYIEDRNAPSPAQMAYQNMLCEKMEQVLSTLPPREARVLRLRFGLGHERAYTLEEVGQKFGLTRERIRQIEGTALRRLRHPCRARLLREYI
jgi:RNA polymerase primary sigma factor